MPPRTPSSLSEVVRERVAAAPPGSSGGPPSLRPLRDPTGLSPHLRMRRAVTLLIISILVPGSAQLVTGHRTLGRVAVRCWLATVGFVVLLGLGALFARDSVIGLLTNASVLTAAAAAVFVAALVWPLLVIDAWRLGQPAALPRRHRQGLGALAAALVVLLVWPLTATGQRLWAAADLISGVFGSGHRSAAVNGRYTVLLLGGDAGPDRVGVRPDSITLVSVDAATGKSVLFSLPRNLENVPFEAGSAAARALPRGWSCGDKCLLNALYTWGGQHKELFAGAADPGAEAMKQAVEGITGLQVNYYVLVDLAGFRQLIDAMGGITLTVGAKVPIGGETSRISGWIQPGRQRLDGYHALWFARSRALTSDYDRMARQRCVMTAMVNQLDPLTVLGRFQAIAAAGKHVVSTDIPASEIATFVSLAGHAKSQKISSVQFVPPLITPAYPNYAVIRSTVAGALSATPKTTTKPDAVAPAAPKPAQPGHAAGAAIDVRSVCSAS